MQLAYFGWTGYNVRFNIIIAKSTYIYVTYSLNCVSMCSSVCLQVLVCVCAQKFNSIIYGNVKLQIPNAQLELFIKYVNKLLKYLKTYSHLQPCHAYELFTIFVFYTSILVVFVCTHHISKIVTWLSLLIESIYLTQSKGTEWNKNSLIDRCSEYFRKCLIFKVFL